MDRIKPGGDYETYIEEGLDWVSEAPDFGRVVLLMTPHSVRRPGGYCLNEIARAVHRKVIVVPVMVAWSEPPLSICRIQWLDMQDCVPIDEQADRYQVKFARLAEALEQDRLDFEGVQSRLLRLLEPLPFDAEIAQHLSRFTGRRWVFDLIDAWLADANPERVFWLVGSPGIGKTAIGCWLCHHRREIAAFHLCRHGHVQKSDPRRCVLSIAYQLATQLPRYLRSLSDLDLERIVPESNAQTLFDNLVLQPLVRSFPKPDRPVVILIDALDEATEGAKNDLAAFIASEFHKTPDWLRLIITSRPDPAVMQPLQAFRPRLLDASTPENQADLRAYLANELRPYVKGVDVPHTIIESILSRSEGLFLYAEHLRKELEQGRLSLDRLERLPQGLGGAYWQFFERQLPRHDQYRENTRPALEIICAAQEPLDLTTVASILRWDSYRQREFSQSVASLFANSGGRIQPFHKSVIDWLTDADKSGPYFVSTREGHEHLAENCWTEYQRGPAGMSPYVIAHLPTHLSRAERWEQLETVLTDLVFVEAKCAAGMTFSLVTDYQTALDDWPGHAKDDPFRTRPEPMQAWTRDCIRAVKSGQPDPHPDKGSGPVLARLRELPYEKREIRVEGPDPARHPHATDKTSRPSLLPLPTAKVVGNKTSSTAHHGRFDPSSQVDRVQAFAAFVFSHSHVLSSIPDETLPLARNHSMSGYVVAKAETLVHDWNRAWIARGPRPTGLTSRPVCLRTLQGHSNLITGVAVTLEGSRVVSVSRDQTLRVWDARSGDCLRTLREETVVRDVALTDDGLVAACACEDGTLHIWDLVKGARVRVMNAHGNTVNTVSLTGDGIMVISAGSDSTIRVSDVVTGDALRSLHGHRKEVRRVCITTDGKIAVSGGLDKILRVWDVASGQCLRWSRTHPGIILAVSVTPDGRFVASGGEDRTIRVWDVASGLCLAAFQAHDGAILDLALSVDGSRVVSASRDRSLRVWEIASGRCLRTLVGHTNEVTRVVLTQDGNIAISASRDRSLRVWDLATGMQRELPEGHADGVRSVELGPDGRKAVSTSEDKTLRVWSTESGACLDTIRQHAAGRGLAISDDGQTVVSGGVENSVCVWDLTSRTLMRILRGTPRWSTMSH